MEVDHVSDVPVVDPHTEGDRRYQYIDAALHERVVRRALFVTGALLVVKVGG
jgi:hypothetical protein